MPLLLLLISAVTGAAAALFGFTHFRARKQSTSIDKLKSKLPKSLGATHEYADALGQAYIACNLKNGTVFIIDQFQSEPAQLPIQQLESVNLVDEGKKRVSELRLDIALADERRSVYQIQFLSKAVSRSSNTYKQALEIANKWQTRLAPQQQDVETLRAALAPDTDAATAEPAAWQLPTAGGLAVACVASLGAAGFIKPAEVPTNTPAVAAALPQTPVPAAAQTAPTAAPSPVVKTSALVAQIVEPLQPRIEDLSEQSLSPSRRISPDKILGFLDDINSISLEFEVAREIAADDTEALELLDQSITDYLTTQQDVLPRFRRLYSSALLRRDELSLEAVTGGYASRDLSIAHVSLQDEAMRREVFNDLSGTLYRLRFDRVDFMTTPGGLILDSVEIDSPGDGALSAIHQSTDNDLQQADAAID